VYSPHVAIDQGWSVSWEDRPWVSDSAFPESRRQRLATRGPYRAAVPAAISTLPVHVAPEVAAEAAEATAAIARFDARTASLLPPPLGGDSTPFAAVLLRTESVSSSQIENVTAGAKALALATIHERAGTNAQLVAQNVEAMRLAVGSTTSVDERSVLGLHEVLLAGEGSWVGRWREQQVWIGGRGSSPHSATFVPPHHDRVPAAMADLFAFADRVDVPAFTQTALAHAQFETIHPFPDGNGRVGRALVHSMLRRSEITRSTVVPVSAGLLSHTEEYFAALGAYRDGDLDPIVEQFAAAAFRAIGNGQQLLDELTGLRARWLDEVSARRDSVVWRVLDGLLRQPALTVPLVRDEYGVSQPAAERAVDTLQEAGVLTRSNAGRRNRVWVCDDVVQAMDAFGDRARRRFL
jgi:Fic family protein